MKVRAKITIILCFVLSVLLAVFTVGYTFAWFANYASISINLYTDDEGGYFDSGDGSESTPYVIKNYRHLYNLAWLQNMGKFDGGVYYFELGNDINMCASGAYCVIPPIGNDTYPFKGVFDGNGCTISNLVVSTDKDKLSNTDAAHASGYSFSDYVGLFGKTYSSSEITNFILDNPIVEVASENTLYTGTSDAQYCGLAIGYVAGKASSIGVIGGYLCVSKGGYSTYNSILGDISDSLTTSVTGGTAGETGSGDLGYGTSTDIKALYYSLLGDGDDGDTVEVADGYVLPFRYASSDIYQSTYDSENDSNSGSQKSVITTDTTMAYTQEATSNNIGYYVGSNVKVKNYTTSTKLDYSAFYYPNGDGTPYTLCTTSYDSTTGTATVNSDDNTSGKNAPSKEIVKYVYEYGDYLFWLSDYHNSGNYANDNGYLTTLYGQVGNYKGLIIVPDRSIWVAPVQAGTLKFVIMNVENSNIGFNVVRLTRSTAGDYSTKFSASVDYLYFNNQLQSGKAYYFEVDISEDDITAGYEYAVTAQYGKPYIAYIDLGQTGSTTSTDSDGNYGSDYDISAIDFIYSGVTISTSETLGGSFVVNDTLYNATGTRIYFSAATDDGATIVMGFYRNGSGNYSSTDTSDDTYTITVTYYIVTYSAPTDTRSTAYIEADSNLRGKSAPAYGSTYNSS